MDKLNSSILNKLASFQAEPAVTIYIPTNRSAAPPHITENQIRFKNLLHLAAKKLKVTSKESHLAGQLESKVEEVIDDLSFWEQQTTGILVCAVEDNIQMFHLPIDTEEYVSIDKNFHLAPIIGLFNDNQEFYLLTLARHNPRLYIGNLLNGLKRAKSKLPSNIKEALGIDETNPRREHQGSTGGPSSSPTLFNGRGGGGRSPDDEDRLRFLRLIDKIVHGSANHHFPLMLSGTESEIAEYRSISKYPKLMHGTIHGNHTEDDLEHLFNAATSIVREELVQPQHKSAIEEYEQTSGSNPSRVAHDMDSIVEAAKEGRVDKLLANMSQRTADTVQDNKDEVPRLTFPENTGDSKRLNDLVLSVWHSRGQIFNLLPTEMPGQALVAARYRY